MAFSLHVGTNRNQKSSSVYFESNVNDQRLHIKATQHQTQRKCLEYNWCVHISSLIFIIKSFYLFFNSLGYKRTFGVRNVERGELRGKRDLWFMLTLKMARKYFLDGEGCKGQSFHCK